MDSNTEKKTTLAIPRLLSAQVAKETFTKEEEEEGQEGRKEKTFPLAGDLEI